MANVTYTVQNKNGSYDGDMVVKQYTSMAIDAGDTVTVDQPCRGLMILCQGDCTINGTLSMKERGANANPSSSGANDGGSVGANGIQLPFLTSGGTDTLAAANTLLDGCGTAARSVVANFKSISSDGTIISTPRVGGSGGSAGGGDGNSIANGTGGGGSGHHSSGGTTTAVGGKGTCFSGGSGSGGNENCNNAYGTDDYAGPGGQGGTSNHNAATLGGAGNPGGTTVRYFGAYSSGNPTAAGGTGGLLILIVGGNLTIGSGGKITVKGGNGAVLTSTNATYSGDYSAGGGQGGGGRIIIAHRGSYTNNGTLESIGGNAVNVKETGVAGAGGIGGTGAITIQQVL